MSGRGDPLTVLIHTPKTAGTTLNAWAKRHGGPGRAHIERWRADLPALGRIVARADWVSGHVRSRDMRALLEQVTERPLRRFAMVRDPVAQIASHYNWWHVVWRRGPQSFWRQPPYFRALSRQIRRADANDPDQVIAILKEHAVLFLNQQADYLLGGRGRVQIGELRNWLRNFEYVGLNQDLDAMAGAMGLPPLPARGAKNVSRYYVPREMFSTGPVRDFLAHAHAMDFMLYDEVTRMRGADRG